MAQKKLWLTYFLWLTMGFFGMHHFYLGRDRQAFLWWMSIGGYFGLGWFTDIWMIPTYVKDANEDQEHMERFINKVRQNPRPPRSTIRCTIQMAVADALGYLALSAIPSTVSDELMIYFELIVPFAVAIGVHLVGNIGRQQGSLKYALAGAYSTFPLYIAGHKSVVFTSLASSYVFNKYGKEWRRSPRQPQSIIKRGFVLGACGLIYLSLWGSFMYFNLTITSESGETVPFREAITHFFKSPLWNDFLRIISQIWDIGREYGWKEVWQQLVIAMDPEGKAHALKVMGLTSTATEQEISSRYRELSRQWHPDRHKGLAEKEIAQEKFIEIAQAYEILMKPFRDAKSSRKPVRFNEDEL